jgi:O-antigen/teichoic acid export membrane protein
MTTFIHSVRWILFSSVVKRLLIFISYFFFIQFVDAQDLGHFNEFTAILSIILIVDFLSLEFLYITEKNNESSLLPMLQVGFVISLFACLFLNIFSQDLSRVYNSQSLDVIFKFSPMIILMEYVRKSLRTIFQKENRFQEIAFAEILNTILYCGLFCVVLPFYSSPEILVFLYFSGNLLETFYLTLRSSIQIKTLRNIFKIDSLKKTQIKLKTEKKFVFFTTTTHLFGHLGDSSPILLLGSILTSAATGIYALANQLITIPIQLVLAPIERVFFTHLAKCENREIQGKIADYSEFCFSFLWLSWFFAVTNLKILVPIILPEKWSATIDILFPIALIQAFRLLITPIGSIAIIKKKTDIELYYKIFSFIIRGSSILLFAKYGLKEAIYGFCIAQILSYLVLHYLLINMIDSRLWDIYKRNFIYLVSTFAYTLFFFNENKISSIVLKVCLLLVSYFVFLLSHNFASKKKLFRTLNKLLRVK